jgi:uncharacterized protein (DUF4415 family)
MDNLDLPYPDLDLSLESLSGIDDLIANMAAYTPPVPCPIPSTSQTAYSQKISIRIPFHVLTSLKQEAERSGMGYQTLINQILHETSISARPSRKKVGSPRRKATA